MPNDSMTRRVMNVTTKQMAAVTCDDTSPIWFTLLDFQRRTFGTNPNVVLTPVAIFLIQTIGTEYTLCIFCICHDKAS